jgi:hypothetical protein
VGPRPAEHDDRSIPARADGGDDGGETVLGAAARRRADIASRLPDEVEHPDETEGDADAPGRAGTRESWRRRSATGAILTGIALGFREVLETERQDPAIVQETSGVPPKDLPVEADLQEAAPRRNVVHVRPWLLGQTAPPPAPLGEAGHAAPATAERTSTPVPGRAPVRRRLGRRSR